MIVEFSDEEVTHLRIAMLALSATMAYILAPEKAKSYPLVLQLLPIMKPDPDVHNALRKKLRFDLETSKGESEGLDLEHIKRILG